ncbi:MAG: hypothetical protein HY717_13515 [Planctomycetes bacterium]|nr:hypothetical protein [Planctomycetota bacterium]
MKKWIFSGLAAALTFGGGLLAYELGFETTGRSDCHEQIVCPITGMKVCKDQCPLMDPDRPDGPGKIECPLTGELVCPDRCPSQYGTGKSETWHEPAAQIRFTIVERFIEGA